ncbi:MAG: C-GCAxxG-C-C family protein [Acidobacteriia bacterium]|nr:C-GCAxxG-C-C family protein [Terriglobia bacterium]
MDSSNRRSFVKNVGGIAIGAVAGSGVTRLISSDEAPLAVPALPWPYVELDPIAVAERAYLGYSNGGCMYGAFEGIIGELRTKLGAPFDTFPTTMMKYGGGGVAGWGSLCGALNGIAAAIYLLKDSKTGNDLISEIFNWYGVEKLPNYRPKTPKFEIATTVSESQLCHVSVTKWANHTGFKTGSPERAERCAWLTASVAKRTTELLNQQLSGTYQRTHLTPANVTLCLQCHGPSGTVANVHITGGQSNCTSCHHRHWAGGVEF